MNEPMPTSKYALQTFHDVDAAKWQHIVEKVKEASGIDMSSTQGSGTAKGITISWSYSPDTQTLVVDLVKRSFFDPDEKTIDQKIADWIKNA